MDFYVDYSCEDNSETGRIKLTVSDFDNTSIRDVKYAIQDAIQAPVCDQQLFYQEQPVTDDDTPLSRLYFREGDCFKLQFLAAADIPGITQRLDLLKNFAQEIVEKLNRQLPVLNRETLSTLHDLNVRQKSVCRALQELSDDYFHPWKCLKTVAQRHFFVQEGGFDAILEVFKFSQQLYTVGCSEDVFNINEISVVAAIVTRILDLSKHDFNEVQLAIQFCCLSFLWCFGETPLDRKFLVSKDVFPLTVDALLLQPCPLEDTGHIDIASMVTAVNEEAIGCCGGLIEYDSNIQEEVSKMSPLIDKLLFMIDRCQSQPAGYSLYSSQVASNTLFYCTFNVKSAQPLVDCGALEKMINITKKLLFENDSNTPLRYYCCLFLARMRSASLVTLDNDTGVVIDELIDLFLSKHVPSEISKWEEEHSFVWITMVPLVHLAFAAGKEYCCDQINDHESKGAQCSLKRKQSQNAIMEVDEAGGPEVEESQEHIFQHLSFDNREENISYLTSSKRKNVEGQFAILNTPCDVSESTIAGKNDQFTRPGSASTHKLGIFCLVHMLSIKENQQLALTENLLPYLVCLSWHLKCDEKEKLRNSLANFHNVSAPPSLKVISKSVLALVRGLDMVFKY